MIGVHTKEALAARPDSTGPADQRYSVPDLLRAVQADYETRTGRKLEWPDSQRMLDAIDAATALLAALGVLPTGQG